MAINVMLADDHAVVRAGHRFLLGQIGDIRIVAEAEDSDQAYHGYFRYRPDVLVLDLSLPGTGGMAVIRRILARDPEAKILVFTMHEEILYAKRALAAGAKGYLCKNADLELLPRALTEIASGQLFVWDKIARQLDWQADGKADPENPLTVLTNREFEIFCLAARGLGPQEIADSLYISYKTTANYLTQIKRKLKVGSLSELVRLAYLHNVIGN